MKKQCSFHLAENLNRLAHWLRIMGYDAAIYRAVSFDVLVTRCQKERRILLTRSSKEASDKRRFQRILIKSTDYRNQLTELGEIIECNNQNLFTRCPKCNHPLIDSPSEKVATLIPAYICEAHKIVQVCRGCGHIYWQGTHFEAIKNTLRSIFP
ncbi:MAG: Mut7-C RNAse domain-containing protein [Candidatus Cloacimonetes bacterium]|nr:Mut7-C RNAse domain-containing protein [Candidatus Cloacimonadota bacterium]